MTKATKVLLALYGIMAFLSGALITLVLTTPIVR